MNTTQLRLRGKLVILPFIPYDKGNLARQLRSYNKPGNKGFVYVLSGIGASYNVIVNEGRRDRPLSRKEAANVGYWDRAAEALTTFINSNQNTQLNNDSYRQAVRKTKWTEQNERLFERSLKSG